MKPFRPTRVDTKHERRNTGPERCVVPSCAKATRFGKAHCYRHIHLTPYAIKVAGEIAQREDEVTLLDRDAILDEGASLVGEASAILWEKRNVTAPGLTRLMNLTHQQARTLFQSLSAYGIAEIYKNRRGVVAAKALGAQEIDL